MFRASFLIMCGVLLALCSRSALPAQGKGNMKDQLSSSDEKQLRRNVYDGSRQTGIAESGTYKGFEVLIVPKDVSSIYAKQKVAALVLLRQIVLGGRAQDALLASGFALSLAQDPVTGAILSLYKESDFDALIENQTITYRQFLAGKIQECIDKHGSK
jgi:hypothetical protein